MSSLIFFHLSAISIFPLSTFFGLFITVVVIYLLRGDFVRDKTTVRKVLIFKLSEYERKSLYSV